MMTCSVLSITLTGEDLHGTGLLGWEKPQMTELEMDWTNWILKSFQSDTSATYFNSQSKALPHLQDTIQIPILCALALGDYNFSA